MAFDGKSPLLVFTDLDGSLLDHYTYSHAPAEAALRQLNALSIPVIANTSKTFSELLEIRRRLNNQDPFIAENGAAIYLPKQQWLEKPEGTSEYDKYWVKSFCPPRAQWQQLIEEVGREFSGQYQTFSSGGIDAIMTWTGLNQSSAALASQRQFGEPVHWTGSEENAELFTQRLENSGATVLKGGRFIHVSGNSDKGTAMRWLAALYENTPTLALGDGPNDIAMLNAADYAVVIKSPAISAPNLLQKDSRARSGNLLYSEACGPEGWAEGVKYFLEKLNIH